MTAYPIPDAALDDRLGFVGTAGSGKTYNAGSALERVLTKGGRIIIPDPLGVWWGLGLDADGKSPAPWREKLVVFGGQHGDMPLFEHSGALIGETVAGMAESAILDLSGIGTKAAERRFMLAFLTALYRHATNEPVHLAFDEADMWAPQTVRDREGDANKLLGMMETVVRRGRVRGFIPWLISQRPAVLNKDVLSQVDGLVAFKLTASQDRKAIGDWVSGQADQGQWPAISASLPTLPTGTGIVWLPTRDILATVAFPPKITFDSSRTPKRGERVVKHALKPLDLDKLKKKLAAVEQEAKANDPRHLKAEVARLTRELASAQKGGGAPSWPDQREEVAKLCAELTECQKAMERLTASATELQRRHKLATAALGGESIEIPVAATPQRRATSVVEHHTPAPQARIRDKSMPQSDGSVPSGTRPTLSSLASVYPAGMTRGQLAARVGIKKRGSTFSAYLSKLRTSGLIDERDNLIFASEAGAAAIGDIEPLPGPGPELARSWASKLSGTGPIVEYLLARHPEWIEREEIATALNINPGGSTLSAYVSKLFTAGVVEKSGSAIRLADEVMGG
jgi:hypothetical protein